MPTGYTDDVRSGKVTEFRDFALGCARAFGALIMMRDEPGEAPIPERFEPSDYYVKQLELLRAKRAELLSMSPTQRASAALASRAGAVLNWNARRRDIIAERQRYEAMLERVRAWRPPTPDHVELRTFMERQLVESIDFDCGHLERTYGQEPKAPEAEEWFADHLGDIERQIARCEEEHRKEVQRTEERNRWIADLRASLGEAA